MAVSLSKTREQLSDARGIPIAGARSGDQVFSDGQIGKGAAALRDKPNAQPCDFVRRKPGDVMTATIRSADGAVDLGVLENRVVEG